MFEKCNPSHPDKIADRIAGAIVDLAYTKQEKPKVAVEVLIGHERCNIIAETSVQFEKNEIDDIVKRILKASYPDWQYCYVDYKEVPQDPELAKNQEKEIRCGDNGIFKGTFVSCEEKYLTDMVKTIYVGCPYDGKYLINNGKITMCQSNIKSDCFKQLFPEWIINPLGDWTGGINVDCGATNRKLGSDLGRGVTGGGLHGKDLSKADTSVNIWCHLEAQKTKQEVKAICNIGDTSVQVLYENGDEKSIPYSDIVEIARDYIKRIGGFEKLAEWGLVR